MIVVKSNTFISEGLGNLTRTVLTQTIHLYMGHSVKSIKYVPVI